MTEMHKDYKNHQVWHYTNIMLTNGWYHIYLKDCSKNEMISLNDSIITCHKSEIRLTTWEAGFLPSTAMTLLSTCFTSPPKKRHLWSWVDWTDPSQVQSRVDPPAMETSIFLVGESAWILYTRDPETNSQFTPENGYLEDVNFLFGMAYFQGWTVGFREGMFIQVTLVVFLFWCSFKNKLTCVLRICCFKALKSIVFLANAWKCPLFVIPFRIFFHIKEIS